MRHLLTPRYVFDAATDITPAFLLEHGIRGCLIDLDGTLVSRHQPIGNDHLVQWLDSLRAAGIRPNRERMAENLHRSLMLVTCLNPYIGYENAAKTAKKAYAENISLKEACVALGFLTPERFDEVFKPEQMV